MSDGKYRITTNGKLYRIEHCLVPGKTSWEPLGTMYEKLETAVALVTRWQAEDEAKKDNWVPVESSSDGAK